jgi:hypothetical protein
LTVIPPLVFHWVDFRNSLCHKKLRHF